MRGKPMSKPHSRRDFKTAVGVHPKNFKTFMRGGIRL